MCRRSGSGTDGDWDYNGSDSGSDVGGNADNSLSHGVTNDDDEDYGPDTEHPNVEHPNVPKDGCVAGDESSLFFYLLSVQRTNIEEYRLILSNNRGSEVRLHNFHPSTAVAPSHLPPSSGKADSSSAAVSGASGSGGTISVNIDPEAHPCHSFEGPGVPYFKSSLVLEKIEKDKLSDPAFWLLVERLCVWPAADGQSHAVSMVYEKLLPSLTSTPLPHILATNMAPSFPTAWKPLPFSGDPTYIHCVMESVQSMLVYSGFTSLESEYVTGLLFKWQCVRRVQMDLSANKSIREADVQVLRRVCLDMAWQSSLLLTKPLSPLNPSVLAALQQLLSTVQRQAMQLPLYSPASPNLYLALIAKAGVKGVTGTEQLITAQTTVNPVLQLKKLPAEPALSSLKVMKGTHVSTPTHYPLFDRLRMLDNVENHAGPAKIPTLFRPVEFTQVPDCAHTFDDVMQALRFTDQICVRLQYQHGAVSNTYLLAMALLQHVFTIVIPLPLPPNHPRAAKQCLWQQPLKAEVQVEMLRHLRLISRHVAACSFSLRNSRSSDAARILTMACITCLADVLIRTAACDAPSQLCLHMSAMAPATPRFFLQPFGLNIASFQLQSGRFHFSTPELTTARTRVLDYFGEVGKQIKPDHTIFAFEKTMTVGSTPAMLEQLCWAVGFPPTNLALYISGEQTAVLDHYPELAYYRDIVFMFKYMMTPTAEALPASKAWKDTDAVLKWKYDKASEAFVVTGFDDKVLKCFEHDESDSVTGSWQTQDAGSFEMNKQYEKHGWFRGLFGSKTARAPPPAASASALCGQPIFDEEDVLHIKNLPNLGSSLCRLKQQDCELLISYLTVPYIRIPLVLNFFADPDRINTLGDEEIRAVLDGV